MENVLAHTDSDIPESLKDKDVAKAFYGLTVESLSEKLQDPIVRKEIATQTALQIDDLIKNAVLDNGKPIIDWQYKTNITGKLLIEIGDYLIDEVRDKYNINLSFKEMDDIADRCIKVRQIKTMQYISCSNPDQYFFTFNKMNFIRHNIIYSIFIIPIYS